jgi:fructose-1,6-bisphosphatase/inositol monophosphatase family enzyme
MIEPGEEDLRRFVALALDLARHTRRIVLDRVRGGFAHRRKADSTFVTEIDLAVEDHVRERLARELPEHGIRGEERDDRAAASDFEWIVDPIDGTLSLRHGVPLYGTLLALRHRGRTVVGVIDLPALGRTYHAARGLGAFRDGIRLHLAPPESVDDEIVAVGDRLQFDRAGKLDVFDRLLASHSVVRTYADCFGHALAIDGSVGAMVDFGLRVWDVAATEVLVTEAGGAFVEVDRRGEFHDVVFGKPGVVEKILGTFS